MANNVESLVFDLLVRDQQAADGLTRVGRAASGAAKDTDALTQKLNELSRKSVEARVRLAGDKDAQAALDKMDARLISLDRRVASPNLRVEGAARAIAEISAVDLEMDKLGGKGGTAEQATAALGTGAGGLSGPAGMGALIAAGVALSPVVATVGLGLGGLGVAAAKTVGPILEAGTATRAQQKALAGLDPAQRAAYQSLGDLKTQFAGFSKSLQPQVLTLFSDGLHIAGGVLHDVQPVAKATGDALHTVLANLGADLHSAQWQSFFTWMAANAGPDVKLLGQNIIDLVNTLPQLLMNLQPVATELLQVTDDAFKLVNAIDKLDSATVHLGDSSQHSAGFLSIVGNAVKNAATEMVPGLKALPLLKTGLDATTSSSGPAAKGIADTGHQAAVAAPKVMTLAQEVAHLTDAYNKAISPMLAYTNAEITQADDAVKLQKALKASHDQVGLGTAAQRASFSAANTYIQDLLNTAAAADKSGKGIDDQIRSIQQALPALLHVKSGTTDYWREVQNLVGWLNRLRQEKLISEQVTITGVGKWTISQGGNTPGKPLPLAAGGLITAGTTPTADDVLVRASKGELMVPAHMVSAGLVDHLRGMLPGFAGGGVVGSYSGGLAGLQPWASANNAATVKSITASVADALSRQFPAGFLGPGFGSYGADIQAVLGAMGLPLSLTANWLRQIQTESGGNPRAVNLWDSNAAAGHPSVGLLQLIPSTFHAYAGPYSNTPPLVNYGGGTVSEDPMAQIYTAIHYAWARYGAGMASVIGQGHGYDQGGYLPTGWSLAYNGTGRPEPVGPAAGVTYNVSITVNVPPTVNPKEAGRQVADLLGAHLKGGGRLYPAGMTPR